MSSAVGKDCSILEQASQATNLLACPRRYFLWRRALCPAMGNSSLSAKSALATAAPAAPLGIPLANKWRLNKGRVKITVGLSVLMVGGYGLFSEQNFVSSSNAVVSAYIVAVRTPIDGLVQGLPAAANLRVQRGQNLGYVENPRVDQQHLENLRVIEERARSEADAMLIEQASLQQQQKELLARARAHAKAVANRIQLDLLADERVLLAKQAAERQAALDLERARQLRASGIIADADFDRRQTQYDIAVKEAQGQQAIISAQRAEADSAANGVFIEPGYNEIDYSRQRFDDIRLRLAEIHRSLAALQIQAQAAKEDLDKETQHAQLMTRAELDSPISGLLWKLDAISGERLGTGDSVVEFIDCQQAFVLVEIPQDRIPDLTAGAQARVRLSGELEEHPGILASLTLDPRKDENHKLAALPTDHHNAERTIVRVDLNARELHGECLVGRTARVLLSTNGSSIASRWLRRSF